MIKENTSIDIVGVTSEAKSEIEAGPLIVTSVRTKYAYKEGKRSDEITGYGITAVVLDGALAGQQIQVKTDTEPQFSEGEKVRVKIDGTSVYGKTQYNSNYASVEVSFHGTVLTIKQ